MSRRKTVHELRSEIATSSRLQSKSQVEISTSIGVNQATVSRILRGRFKRCSPAVQKLCRYAAISCITTDPMGEFEASVDRLARLAQGRSPKEKHAMKLIRLAAEILESDLNSTASEAAHAGRLA